MKVKAVKEYYDKVLKRNVKDDQELEVDEARGEELISAGVAVEIVDENGDKSEETEKIGKKQGRKKAPKDE